MTRIVERMEMGRQSQLENRTLMTRIGYPLIRKSVWIASFSVISVQFRMECYASFSVIELNQNNNPHLCKPCGEQSRTI